MLIFCVAKVLIISSSRSRYYSLGFRVINSGLLSEKEMTLRQMLRAGKLTG